MCIGSLGPLAGVMQHNSQGWVLRHKACDGNCCAIYAFHVSVKYGNILVKFGPFKYISPFWTGSRANNWSL